MNDVNDKETLASGRWALLRDIGVLQVKLVVDGLRDLMLVPASLIAGVLSLVSVSDGKAGMPFYRLLHFGKRTEQWINLFGAEQNAPEPIDASPAFGDGNMDALVRKVESLVVDEYKRGGVTAQAKERIDKIIDTLRRKRR
jgi:hypothetical protein